MELCTGGVGAFSVSLVEGMIPSVCAFDSIKADSHMLNS